MNDNTQAPNDPGMHFDVSTNADVAIRKEKRNRGLFSPVIIRSILLAIFVYFLTRSMKQTFMIILANFIFSLFIN